MAVVIELWHRDLSVLPVISGECVDKFVKSRCVAAETSIRGYKFFLEGYIHDFEVCARAFASFQEPYSIRARCFRSMKKNESPHQLQIDLTESAEAKSWQCSCAAGAALCHHAVALLYQLQHYQKMGLKAVPPVVSKTSLPQTWHVPTRASGIQSRSLNDVVVQKPRKPASGTGSVKRKRESSGGVTSKLFNPVTAPLSTIDLPGQLCPYMNSLEWKQRPQYAQLWQAELSVPLVKCAFGDVPKGSLLSYQQPVRDIVNSDLIVNLDVCSPPIFVFPDLSSFVGMHLPLNSDLQGKYNGLYVTDKQSPEFELMTRMQSDSVEWHNLRKNRITASNFKRVYSRRDNFKSLCSQLLSSRNVTTAAMKYGKETESKAAEVYRNEFGRNVYRVGFVINPTCYCLGCSPDRRVYDPDQEGSSWGLLEIKCVQATTVECCDYLQTCGDKKTLKKSHAHFFQVMGQMGLTGSEWCDFLFMPKKTILWKEYILILDSSNQCWKS